MAGNKNSKTKLNNTLIYISKILNKENIKNWFIGYGTLLGIVREDSCIYNDDDIDIMCPINIYDDIKKIINKSNLEYWISNQFILKTKETHEYSSIDFYMCEITNGEVLDLWEKIKWKQCFPLTSIEWNGTKLYVPINPEEKLVSFYGHNWRIPISRERRKSIDKLKSNIAYMSDLEILNRINFYFYNKNGRSPDIIELEILRHLMYFLRIKNYDMYKQVISSRPNFKNYLITNK